MNRHEHQHLTDAERTAIRAAETARREDTARTTTRVRTYYDENPPVTHERVPFTTSPTDPADAAPGMQRMASAYDQAGTPTKEQHA